MQLVLSHFFHNVISILIFLMRINELINFISKIKLFSLSIISLSNIKNYTFSRKMHKNHISQYIGFNMHNIPDNEKNHSEVSFGKCCS